MNGEEKSFQNRIISDTSKWHPQCIYISQQDTTVKFKLPYEEDQSGVANLLFKNKDSEEIFMLDTVKNNLRYYSWILQGSYDVILLYNNGKYIKHNSVSFLRNLYTEIDMENLSVQPSDSESQKWLALRTFNSVVGERKAMLSEKTGSKISGYIFDEKGEVITGASIIIKEASKGVVSNIDGYFEINVDADVGNATLLISFIGKESKEINLTGNSGLIVVMKRDPKLDNIRIEG